MTKIEDVLSIHEETCNKARSIIKEKGLDYNRDQQDKDTLFNMSVCEILGITDNVPQGILVRLSDKFMRLISLTKDPLRTPAVKNESVNDTIEDTINYLIYLKIKYNEIRVEQQVKSKCGESRVTINQRNLDIKLCWCDCGCNNPSGNDLCTECRKNVI